MGRYVLGLCLAIHQRKERGAAEKLIWALPKDKKVEQKSGLATKGLEVSCLKLNSA